MKKFLLIQCFFLAACWGAMAQNFAERYKTTLKGNMIVVGNSIINQGSTRPANAPFNDRTADNSQRDLEYTDVDSDSSTYNSSSARVKNPNVSSSCGLTVKKAYLYWAAAYTKERVDNQTDPPLEPNKFNQVRFRQGSGNYHAITGTVLHSDGAAIPSGRAQSAYVCVADVTQYVTNINNETFTVANMQAPYGNESVGNGYAAGWTLYIVYEDTTQPARNITLFDGFAVVGQGVSPEIKVSGFTTVPAPLPVNAKIAFAALEGESYIGGDELRIKTNKTNGDRKKITAPGREDSTAYYRELANYWWGSRWEARFGTTSNFFNSTITDENGVNTDRNPNSTNLLGFDAGIFDLVNNGNTILGNDTTEAYFYPSTLQDVFYPFMFAFNVEVVTPNVVMEKRVYKSDGITDVTGQNNLHLGDNLIYKIAFQNKGNDDAKNLVIKDILPKNIDVPAAGPNNLLLPAGATSTYNATTRELKITIPDNLVTVNSSIQTISFSIKVVASCNAWLDPCANEIKNQAFASYTGAKNPATLTPGSFNTKFTACGGGVEGPSNFIVDIQGATCTYTHSEIILCTPSIALTATGGFDSYTWKKTSGANQASYNKTGQTLTVTEPGTYVVTKVKAGCPTLIEEFKVSANNNAQNHPIAQLITQKKISGEIVVCPDDGSRYPQVYLCGKGVSLPLEMSIANAKKFVWQKLTPPTGYTAGSCAPANITTGWNAVGAQADTGTRSQRTINEAGEYRLVITYDGGGAGDCITNYYFRVTKNDLEPKANVVDIVCNTPGKITVIQPNTTNYEFALYEGNTQKKAYQSSNEFTITDPGIYKVLIRQTGVPSGVVPCVFELDNLQVRKRTPSLSVTTSPILCKGQKGGMLIQLSDPPYNDYTFKIRKDNSAGAEVFSYVSSGTTTNTTKLTLNNRFNQGSYFVEVVNNYGCVIQHPVVKINEVPELKLTATVRQQLMCGSAVVRVTASGGTKGQSYAFSNDGVTFNNTNSTGDYFDFTVTSAGTYQYAVLDKNGCRATASVNVQQLPPPTIGTHTSKLTNCGAKGKIVLSEPQSTISYTYEYSVDGNTFQSGREFFNLNPGQTYTPTVRYTLGSTSCIISSTLTLDTAQAGILIASAGVVRLIGCGTGVNSNKALVRFSNVQGGQEPYRFSFDGGATWTDTREMWLAPGPYNLSVQDKIECTRTNLKVVVPNKVDAPVFTPSTITYDCWGNGTVTVNNNQSTYTYTYEIDGVLTNTNTFSRLQPGIHTITVHYADANPPSKNVLFLDDFGAGKGHTRTPYMNRLYYYEPQNGSTTLYNGNGQSIANVYGDNVNDGEYTVADLMRPNLWGRDPIDHTGLTDGRILFINIGSSAGIAGVLYQRKMVDIIPNKPIRFSAAFYNLQWGDGVNARPTDPIIRLELYKTEADIALGSSKALAFNHIGGIPGSTSGSNWNVHNVEMNPGNNTELYAVIRSYSNVTGGNDLAIDDIYLYQEPEACTFSQTFTIKIEDGKKFDIDTSTIQITQPKCNGDTGKFQVTLKNPPAVYYVRKDGTATFEPHSGSVFRWDNIPTNGTRRLFFHTTPNGVGGCAPTYWFNFTVPPALTLALDTAHTDLNLGCTPASTEVTVTATGGTGAYQFILKKGTTALLTQTSPKFTVTQTGTYTIEVKDANACTKEVTFTVVQAPTLTLGATNSAVNNNYCTQGGAKGKVEVRVAATPNKDTSPYRFYLNGVLKATQSAATYIYDQLNVGTHTFTVVDQYGCTATHTAEISLPLRADGTSGVVVSKDITCETSPNNQGKLTLKVKDGYPPYSYIVKNSGGLTIQGARAVPLNREATFETASYGVYTIKVTDSKGCSIEGTATLTQAVAPTIAYTTTSVNCYGGNDGTISLTLSGGQAPYTVYLDGVNKGTTNSQLTLTGLSEKANYVVKVVDARSCDKSQTIAVVQPTAPLRAFAVVDKLVGCEKTGANKDKAKVRFTNVTGGSGDYRYKFDGNFDIYKEGWLPAGTHTITVKDKNGCEYPVSIKVDSRIAAPTATTYTITTYDCSGKATVEFTGSPNNYNYKYKIDGKTATGTTATITGLVPGSYTLTIEYTLQASLDSNLLFFEDFGKGAAECLPSDRTGLPCGNSAGYHQITNYTAGSTTWYNIPPDNCSSPKIWVPVKDHTSGGTDPLGRFFIADSKPITADGELFYKRKITDLKPNSNIKFEFYVLNLFREDRKHHATYGNALEPNLQVRLVANDGVTVVGTPISTGKVPNSVCGAGMSNWHLKEGTLNVGTHTEVTIEFRSNGGAPHVWGNDFALDDIKVYQMPESCPQSISKTVVVPSGEEFKATLQSKEEAKCYGGEGKATFKIENLRGGAYRVSVGSTVRTGSGYDTNTNTTTFTVDRLRAGTHTIRFNYQGAGANTCSIDRTVTIVQPDELTLTGTVEQSAMCSNDYKATVKVSAAGGVGPYTYEYLIGGVVTRTQTSTGAVSFANVVTGTATFRVKDANGCTSANAAQQNIQIRMPQPITFTVSATACYSGNADGQITVTVTGGNGNYKVKLNAGNTNAVINNSYTFSGLTQGSYTVTVIDGYGCSAEKNVRIWPSLNVNLQATAQSGCKAGKIEVRTSGGAGSNVEFNYVAPGGTLIVGNYTDSKSFTVPTFTGAVQTWTVYVRSADCERAYQIAVRNSGATGFAATTQTPTCEGSATGSILLNQLTGDMPYTISYVNPQGSTSTYTGVQTNTYTLSNLTAGIYTVTLTDRYGCKHTQAVWLRDIAKLTGTFDKALDADCKSSQVSLTLTFDTNTYNTYTANSDIWYKVNSGVWTKVTSQVTHLGAQADFVAGSTIQVYYKTTNQGGTTTICTTAGEAIKVPAPVGGVTVVTNLGNFTNGCSGATSGFTATVTVPTAYAANGPFQYSKDNGLNWEPAVATANTNYVFTDLVVGRTYQFMVKDKDGCKASSDQDIYAGVATPAMWVVAVAKPVCAGGTGELSITVNRNSTYRIGALTYAWTIYEKSTTTGVFDIPVAGPTPRTFSSVKDSFTHSVGIIPGKTYYVVIEETGGDQCKWGSRDAIVRQLDPIVATVISNTSISCDTPGMLEVNATGGGGQYTYTLENLTTPGAYSLINSVNVGSNRVQIQRDNITPALQYPQTAPQTISVRIKVSDQYGCYAYVGTATFTIMPTPNIYTVTHIGCREGAYTLTVVPVLQAGTTPSDGTAEVTQYEYSIDGGQTKQDSNIFNNLVAGTYPIWMKDKATGCIVTTTHVIHETLEATIVQTKPLTCGAQGEISITADKGSGNYEYVVTLPGGTVLPSVSFTGSSATYNIPTTPGAGTYTITLRDQGAVDPNCGVYTQVIEVPSPELPQLSISTRTATCHGANNGAFYVVELNKPVGNTYTYKIERPGGVIDNALNNSLNKGHENLSVGVYTVTVKNNTTLCENVYTVTIREPQALTINAAQITVTTFQCVTGGTEPAVVTVPMSAISGGTPSYTLSFAYAYAGTTDGNRFLVGDARGGIVTVTVRDASGCTTDTAVTVARFEALGTLTATVITAGSCVASETIQLSVIPPTGVTYTAGALLYYRGTTAPSSVSILAGWQASDQFNIAPNHTDSFWVGHKDTGCRAQLLYTSADPNTFRITAEKLTNVSCKGSNDGVVTFTLSNTVSGHTYQSSWVTTALTMPTTPNQTAASNTLTFVQTGLAPGIYTLTVESVAALGGTGCKQEYGFTIAEAQTALTATTEVVSITCAGNDGQIKITQVAGGWGGYQYYVSTAAPTPTSAVWTSTNVFSSLHPGTYHIAVRDSGGCQENLTGATLTIPATITGTLTVTQENCSAGTGALSVRSVTGGDGVNYRYQLLKNGQIEGAPQVSTEFLNLGAGSYQVVVSDSWGCTNTLTQSITLYDPVVAVGVELTKEVTCSPATGATLSVTYQGGNSGQLRYILTNQQTLVSTPNTTGIFTNVGAGTYSVSVVDGASGCATQSTEISVTDAATVSFTYTQTNVSCHGASNGVIEITLPGTQTQTDYEIAVTGGSPLVTRTETVNTTPKSIRIPALAAGVYTVTVRSSRNCTETATITLTEPQALIVSSTTTVTTHFRCDSNNEAQQVIVQAVADGGSGNYRYSFELFDGVNTTTTGGYVNTTGVYSITSNGTYTQTLVVYVQDANGCTASNSSAPIVIPPLNRITSIKASRLQAISCAHPEQVRFSIVGGTNQGYTVSVRITGSGVATPSTQNLAAGTSTAIIDFATAGFYEVTVTDQGTGCYATVSYTIADFNSLQAGASQNKAVSCYGGNDGEIELIVRGYQGAFTYEVLSGTTTIIPARTVPGSNDANRRTIITGLLQGSYQIRIVETQSPNCTFTTTQVMVSGPAQSLSVTTTVTNRIKCGVGQTGAFAVNVSGGWGGYQYRLLVGSTPYAPYGTFTDTNLFEGVVSNTYTIEVKDESGCITSTLLTMSPPIPITAVVTGTMVKCFSDREGIVTVSNTTGGSGNYTYELREVGGAVLRGAQSSPTFTGLDARQYVVRIIDGWGCDTFLDVEVSEPQELKVVASIASLATCNRQASISLEVTGGTGAYTYYMITGGVTQTIAGSTLSVTAGIYEFFVRDANGCQSRISNLLTVQPWVPISITLSKEDIRCNGDNSGRILFTAAGGLGNYQYRLYKAGVLQATATAIQINATQWAFSGLYTGTYQVVVESAGCTETQTTTLTEAVGFTVATNSTNISCNGKRDGTISMTVTGGTGGKQYTILKVGEANARFDRWVDSGEFKDLDRGIYIVRAQDENGCYTDVTFDIKEPDALRILTPSVTGEVCKGASDGTVSVTITGGTQPYSTSLVGHTAWATGVTTYTGLAAGEYTLMVRDANGCEQSVGFTIAAGVDLQATATVEYSCGNNQIANTIRASVNPTEDSQTNYSLDGATPRSSGVFQGVGAGVHTITYIHSGGCVQTVTVNVTAYTSLTATTATKTDMSCYNVNDGTITFAVSGGTGSYTYELSPAVGTFDKDHQRYTDLGKGQYTVKVTDNELRCELSQTFIVVEPPLLIAKAETVTETCYQANDGQISFKIEGGRAPYNYALKKPDGTAQAAGTGLAEGVVVSQIGLSPGNYTLEYTDGNCSQTLVITVASAPSVAPKEVNIMFECSVASTTLSQSYLEVVFENADGRLTTSNTSYSIDGGAIEPFVSFDGNKGYTKNLPTGMHSLTIHYKGEGMSTVCSEPYAGTISVTRYDGLMVTDVSDAREINKVRVRVTGGNPEYSVYFNGSYENGEFEYTLKPTDPTIRKVGNREFKVVVVEVSDSPNEFKKNTCTTTLTIEKEYIKSVPPDFFTPNGDGQNDGWDPDMYRSYPNLTVDIYDRYGRFIKTLHSGEVWDGRYEGKEMPSGDYWYIFKTHEEGDDAQDYIGHFTLYR